MDAIKKSETKILVPFTIRFEPDLHEKLKEKARRSRMSLNQYCLSVLEETVVDFEL